MGAATLVARVVAAAGFSLLVVWTMRWTDLLHALTAFRLPGVIVTLAMAHKQILTAPHWSRSIWPRAALSPGTTAENRVGD
jgi:hypothetical protein